MQVAAGGQDATFGPLGRRRSRRECRHLARQGLATACMAGLRPAWGMARSSFYAMTSGQHAEQPPAKRRGPKPAISDQALLVAIEAAWTSPWEGEGYRKTSRLRVCRNRVARKRVSALMRENNLLRPTAAAAVAAIPMTVRSSLMPRTSSGVSRWTTAGAGSSPPSSIGTPSVRLACSASEALRRPAADLHGACRAVWLDRGYAGSTGLALRMDHGSEYLSDQHPQVLVAPAVTLVAEPPTASPSGSIAPSPSAMVASTGNRLRDAVRTVELYNPVDRAKLAPHLPRRPINSRFLPRNRVEIVGHVPGKPPQFGYTVFDYAKLVSGGLG